MGSESLFAARCAEELNDELASNYASEECRYCGNDATARDHLGRFSCDECRDTNLDFFQGVHGDE